MQRTVRKAEAGKIGARALANIAYGAAHLSEKLDKLDDKLFAALGGAVLLRTIEFTAQAMATAGRAEALS